MEDGEVYNVWVMFYGGFDYGTFSDMTVTINYDREFSDFSGTIKLEDFTSKMAEAGGVLFTLVRNGDTLTMENADGEIIGQGRVANSGGSNKSKKPKS